MKAMRNEIRFLLNDREERLSSVRSSDTLLDHLRLTRLLKGTKEGCAEGDCGACTVLVGRRTGDTLVYEPVNACIRLLASVDLCHVVTVEHVGRDGLHPVQSAMIDLHGSQCGFCTPGFVMSLYALWMRKPKASETEIEEALQGNLCRCTGYQPIIAAAKAAGAASPANDPLLSERARIRAALDALDDGARVDISTGDDRVIIPASAADLADVLADLPKPTIVAGSTDVGLWITKFMRNISPGGLHQQPRRPAGDRDDPRRRHPRRRRHLRRLPGHPRRRVPSPLGLLAPHRRLAGPRHGHRRRQRRQWLADRRHAPGADRPRRHRDAAQRRRHSAPCRSKPTSSPTASRTAKPGEFVEIPSPSRARRPAR